ncbi:MAG: pyridoxamine 5'-phosphate oxidase family protein [Pseudomonadota bacterium]
MSDGDPNLVAVLAGIWATLERAKADAKHAWRYPAFCTMTADGWPTARTVGLREVLRDTGHLAIHTDVRSAKIEELLAEPKCSLMFYNARTQEQLRVAGAATIRASDEAVEVWASLPVHQHHNYSVEPAPGTEISTWNGYTHGTDPATISGHFRVIDIAVQHMDWIRLDRPVEGIGHKRAAFDVKAGRARWLVP